MEQEQQRLNQLMMAKRRELLEQWQPPTMEMVAADLIMRAAPDGLYEANISLMVNGVAVVLSRKAWEDMLPRILRLVYGSRVAEAGIVRVVASIDDAESDATIESQTLEAVTMFSRLVVEASPLDLPIRGGMTQQPVSRPPEQLTRALRRRQQRQAARAKSGE